MTSTLIWISTLGFAQDSTKYYTENHGFTPYGIFKMDLTGPFYTPQFVLFSHEFGITDMLSIEPHAAWINQGFNEEVLTNKGIENVEGFQAGIGIRFREYSLDNFHLYYGVRYCYRQVYANARATFKKNTSKGSRFYQYDFQKVTNYHHGVYGMWGVQIMASKMAIIDISFALRMVSRITHFYIDNGLKGVLVEKGLSNKDDYWLLGDASPDQLPILWMSLKFGLATFR